MTHDTQLTSVRPIRIVIVDDHEILADSLARLLDDDPGLSVIGKELTARAGLERAASERPDVVIMDYSLPDMDGAAATRLLRAKLPDIAVIMLTGTDRPGAYSAAIEAGCAAWVRKTRASHDLLDAIHRVAAGERVRAEEYEELPPLNQLVVHYQPVVELASERVVGFEALVRWQHPQEGVLLPGRFLPFAEATGYITDIDRYVTEVAVSDLLALQRIGSRDMPVWVSVNMSAVSLMTPEIVDEVWEVTDASGVDPETIVFEITETALLDDSAQIDEKMCRLKKLGFQLSLDDFGTAFSSLSYLRRFPFDHVKLDTSFTAELPYTPRAVLLVESIKQLAASMGATGIAEGIESSEQAACLIDAGWHLGQGFLFSKAVPLAEARLLVRGEAVR